MKNKFIQLYSDIALRVSELSHARRLQVGAIVVKDDRIISIGYTGMPAGWDNNCEDEITIEEDEKFIKGLKTKPEVLHAETNALAKIARSTNSSDGASIFITHAPCLDCAKLVYQSGIKSVYYRNSYKNTDGIDFLNKCNVEVTMI